MDEKIISLAVAAKLAELDTKPAGVASGRLLTGDDLRKAGIELSDDQLRGGLALNFRDIVDRLGIQFFQGLPAAALEQFVFRSILRNDDCAGLLKSLINSFMVTYLTEETSHEAYAHLEGLEELRGKVAKARGLNYVPVTSKTTH